MNRKKKIFSIITLSLVAVSIGVLIPTIYFSRKPTFIKIVIDNNFLSGNSIVGTDLNGDHRTDLLACAYYGHEISWWEYRNGNFTKHQITSSFLNVVHAHSDDIDNDGDMDIIATAENLNEIAWWENDFGNFTKHIVNSSYSHPLRVNTIDFDHDNDIDILSTSYYEVSWWENDGNLNFIRHPISNDTFSTYNEHHHYIHSVDIDGDGFLDIITGGASVNYGGLFIWKNENNGNFTKILTTSNYNRVHDIRIDDMDGDGDKDFICGSASSHELDWFENTGDFSLKKHSIAVNFYGSGGGFPCDIDKDGDKDVIGVAYDGDKLSWFENVGLDSFNEHIINNILNRATSCWAFDVDLDSDLDIFTIAGNEVALWKNMWI